MDGFLFTPQLSHWIIAELWHDLENHTPQVRNKGAMYFRTLLHQDFGRVKADSGDISVDRITIQQNLIAVF
jgi:hypothetical protein